MKDIIIKNMILGDSVIRNETETMFLNSMARAEYDEIMEGIVINMVEDLSIITGLSKHEILDNYIRLNSESVLETILRKEGKPLKKINWVLEVIGE